MARSSVEVTRVEILLPPPVAEAVGKVAKRNGMSLGVWFTVQGTKNADVPYVQPPRGRKPKPLPDAPPKRRGKK